MSDSFTPVPLVPDLRLMGAAERPAPDRHSRASHGPIDKPCAICGVPAERRWGASAVCQLHFEACYHLANRGVTDSFSTLRRQAAGGNERA